VLVAVYIPAYHPVHTSSLCTDMTATFGLPPLANVSEWKAADMVPPDMLPPLEATAAGSRSVEVGTIVSAHFISTANPWPACGRRETSQGHTTVETLPSERKVWTLPLSARRAPKIISNINQLPLVCTAPPCEPPDLHRSQPSPSSFQYRARQC
jgi:hypothetical protein